MKLRKLVVGLAATAVLMLGTVTMSFAGTASAPTEIKVNKVQDITFTSMATDVQSIDNTCDDIVEGQKTYEYYYKFTLNKPSYIWLDMYVDVLTCNYAGDAFVYYGKTATTCTEQIYEGWADGQTGSYGHMFEAGTYYIKTVVYVEKPTKYLGDAMIKDTKHFNLTLYAQEVSRDNNVLGISKETAVVMKNYKGTGCISKDVKTQWFKFSIDSKSDIDFLTTVIPPTDWAKCADIDVKLYDKDGVEIGESVGGHFSTYYVTEEDLRTSITGSTKAVPAGTYYVSVTTKRGVYPVVLSLKVKDVYAPNKPKAITYKSGDKFVKGNAEKGSTVYVKYNGKTTKAVTDKYGVYKVNTSVLKVGKDVQIWAVDKAKNKSAVVKVTVKNRQLSAPKVKTAKKNTKLVKGTAKKGLTIQVTYGGKTFKKKLTSASYSVKVSKKLAKGSVVSVKVVDAYGNYSKTVTYKVK